MSRVDLSNYITVAERVAKFIEQHPEGSLTGSFEFTEIAGEHLIVYTAKAYRHPEDKRPGVGTATEPYPGTTSFTKGSELMNAETSAWGRAIAAVGIVASREIATAQEVRQTEQEIRTAQEAGEALPPERVDELWATIKDAKIGFQRLCLVFGAVGAEAPKIKRADSIRKALAELTEAQAEHLQSSVEAQAGSVQDDSGD